MKKLYTNSDCPTLQLLGEIRFSPGNSFGPAKKKFRQAVMQSITGVKPKSSECGFYAFMNLLYKTYFPARDGGCEADNERLLCRHIEAQAADSFDLNDWLLTNAPETVPLWTYLSNPRRMMEFCYVETFRNTTRNFPSVYDCVELVN